MRSETGLRGQFHRNPRKTETFKNHNKSAIIADLMSEAVERAQHQQRHRAAIERILERRKHAPSMTDEELRAAREEGRS